MRTAGAALGGGGGGREGLCEPTKLPNNEYLGGGGISAPATSPYLTPSHNTLVGGAAASHRCCPSVNAGFMGHSVPTIALRKSPSVLPNRFPARTCAGRPASQNGRPYGPRPSGWPKGPTALDSERVQLGVKIYGSMSCFSRGSAQT